MRQPFYIKLKMPLVLYSVLLLNFVHLLAASGTFNPGTGTSFGRPAQNATFDYVIVGGGTAGLAVAMRLAEDPSYTVAVVEAGGFYQIENGNQSVVPAYNSEFSALDDPTANPTVDWGFVTTPQTGANNRSLHYARGKTLGGCSALNANIVCSFLELFTEIGKPEFFSPFQASHVLGDFSCRSQINADLKFAV